METVVNTVVGIIIGSMLAIGAVNVGELLAQILIRRDEKKRNRA